MIIADPLNTLYLSGRGGGWGLALWSAGGKCVAVIFYPGMFHGIFEVDSVLGIVTK